MEKEINPYVLSLVAIGIYIFIVLAVVVLR
jgi:hypothetical protein